MNAADQTALAVRICRALGRLGYPVPLGAVTPESFAAVGPAVRHFVARLDPAVSRRVREAASGAERARIIAEAAEARVARLGPAGAKAGEVISALATGFLAYRNMQHKVGMLAGLLDSFTNLAATKRRS